MNSGGYIKFILTLIAVLIAWFGYLAIQSVDRLRTSNLKVAEKLDALNEKIASGAMTAAVPRDTASAAVANAEVANREFFDPGAVRGGRLIQTLQADPPNLNPYISGENTAMSLYGLCTSTLAERNWAAPEEFQPMLAESWTISPDHKTYRIKLRKGVMWQDFTDPVTGREFRNVEVKAADFKFAVDVVKNPDVNCEPLRGYYQDLESVEIVNDYEFVVKWSKAYYGSLAITLGLYPLPRHYYHDYPGPFDGKKFNDDHVRNSFIVGCGPYRFIRWDRDRRFVFRRNENYWGIRYGIGPALEYLVYDVIKHPNTRFQALTAGDVDLLNLTPDQWVTRTDIPEFRDGRLKKYKYLEQMYSYIGYNERNPLFQDRRVRQALTMLTDREKIRKDIYRDLAEIVTGPFHPKSRYADPSIRPWPYDPAAAKNLLAEAGWKDADGDGILEKDGRKFSFTMLQIATSSTQVRMMPLLKESFAAAGIDMKIQNVEWSVYLQRLNERTYDACCLAWTSPFDPDPYQVWHSSQADAPTGSNHISYKNPELDKLIVELRGTFDMKQRVELAHRIAAILHEDQPYTFLFAQYALVAVSGRYRDVRVMPMGISTETFWTPKAEQKQVPGL